MENELKATDIGRTEIEGIDDDNLFASLGQFDGLEALFGLKELIERGACTLLVANAGYFPRGDEPALTQRAQLVWQMVRDQDSEEGLGATMIRDMTPEETHGLICHIIVCGPDAVA